MANQIGFVKVFSVESYNRQDNSVGYKITGFTEEKEPRLIVFYKDGSEGVPAQGDKYEMILGVDSRFKAVVRFVRVQ